MTIPDNYNRFEHIQKTYIQEHNRRVDRYFKDVNGIGDLTTSRASLKLACRILDGDNQAVMDTCHKLFYDVVGYGRKGLMTFYGSQYEQTLNSALEHPKLCLYFSQDASAVPVDGTVIDHEKTCRLTRYAVKTGEALPAISKANMLDIANEIKTHFMTGNKGDTYTCGKIKVSYTDPPAGFFKGNYWLVNSESEGIALYTKLCNVIDRPFIQDNLNIGTPKRSSTSQASAGTETILGRQYKKRAYRPIANVRFRYAYISCGAISPPVFLIDTTYRHTALIA